MLRLSKILSEFLLAVLQLILAHSLTRAHPTSRFCRSGGCCVVSVFFPHQSTDWIFPFFLVLLVCFNCVWNAVDCSRFLVFAVVCL